MTIGKMLCDWYQAATQEDSSGGDKLSPKELDELTSTVSKTWDKTNENESLQDVLVGLDGEQSCYQAIDDASPAYLYTANGQEIKIRNTKLVRTALEQIVTKLAQLDIIPNEMECQRTGSGGISKGGIGTPTGIGLLKGYDIAVWVTPVGDNIQVSSSIRGVSRQFSPKGFAEIYKQAQSTCQKTMKLPDPQTSQWVNKQPEATCSKGGIEDGYDSCEVQQLYRDSFGKDPTAGGKLLSKEQYEAYQIVSTACSQFLSYGTPDDLQKAIKGTFASKSLSPDEKQVEAWYQKILKQDLLSGVSDIYNRAPIEEEMSRVFLFANSVGLGRAEVMQAYGKRCPSDPSSAISWLEQAPSENVYTLRKEVISTQHPTLDLPTWQNISKKQEGKKLQEEVYELCRDLSSATDDEVPAAVAKIKAFSQKHPNALEGVSLNSWQQKAFKTSKPETVWQERYDTIKQFPRRDDINRLISLSQKLGHSRPLLVKDLAQAIPSATGVYSFDNLDTDKWQNFLAQMKALGGYELEVKDLLKPQAKTVYEETMRDPYLHINEYRQSRMQDLNTYFNF